MTSDASTSSTGLIPDESSSDSSGSGTCLEPATGLIHWWTGEGDYNDIVGGAIGNALSLAYAPGVDGNQAFQMNGADAHLEVEHANSMNVTEFTLSAWIYLDGLGQNQYIFIKDGETFMGELHSFQMYVTTEDRLLFGIGDGTYPLWSLASRSALSAGEWHHVAGTYDGDTQTIYIDGSVDAESAIGPVDPYDHVNPLRIGAVYENGALYYPFGGRLDELQIYDRALSEVEILEISEAGGQFCS